MQIENEPGEFVGYSVECDEWYIDNQGNLSVRCPCCHGGRFIPVAVECERGSGCMHEGEIACETCNCGGWCCLLKKGSKFYFTGWGGDGIKVKVPEKVLKAIKMVEESDSNQQELL